MRYILTIDQSTFSTKVFIINEEGIVVDSVSKKHKQIYPKSGWVEQSPQEIYRNLVEVVKKLKKKNAEIFNFIEGISITNQRETTILWNDQTQEPLYNAIVWQCRRTSDMCKEKSKYNDIVKRKTGLKIDPYFSATKIKWILDYCSINESSHIKFGTIDSWLIYKLTQGEKHLSDVTNASRTLLMNIETLEWDEELCNIFEIPLNILPSICDNDAIFGYSDIEGVLDKRVPISGVIGDSQASLYAQHCFEEGSVKVTLGTGSSLLANAGSNIPICDKKIISTIAWRQKKQTTYAKEAIINCSCDTLNWLKNEMRLFENDSELNDIWKKVKSNEGVYLVPAFFGLSVPWWADQVKASIVGISRDSTYQNIIRAGLESIAYQIYDGAKALNYDSKKIFKIDGGAVENVGLIQFISDILESEVVVSQQSNLSALGSFEMACLKILDKTVKLTDGKKFKPQMDSQIRHTYLKGWYAAVESVLSQKEKGGKTNE